LILPAWCYKDLPEYKGTELERLDENAEYAVKQAKASSEEERLNNMKERLKCKLEAKKAEK